MVTVEVHIQDGKKFEKHLYVCPEFPSYDDMVAISNRERIKATDFEHTFRNSSHTFYWGRFVVSGGKSGQVMTGRRGLGFFVRCENKPTYEELLR